MNKAVIFGILIPFVGTALGSACVFLMKKAMSDFLHRALTGFAGGVMTAAAVWSLLIPAIELSENYDEFSFFPAVFGFWFGVSFLLVLDKLIPHIHMTGNQREGMGGKNIRRSTMLVLAVALHNLPEGMAVGIVYAGQGNADAISLASALALSIGIAVQNFPEGAIISMPLKEEGVSRGKAFFYGVLSGVVEPIGAALTVSLSSLLLPSIPYFLSFAAGAMIYVVVEELIPEASNSIKHSNIGTLFFALGFSVMMILDVALG